MAFTANSMEVSAVPLNRGLRDHVYELILRMLTSPDIVPGSRLSIDTVARDLNVSPTPVREALVLLERTGLVTREAHKGYRTAAPFSEAQLESLFDARLILECGATELAVTHAATVVPQLERSLIAHGEVTKRVRKAAAKGDIPMELLREYFVIDWSFHHQIFEGTHNPFLIDMSEAISTRVHRMRQTLRSGVSDAADALIEHESVLVAVRSGDPALAGAAMREHIVKVRSRSLIDSHSRRQHFAQ